MCTSLWTCRHCQEIDNSRFVDLIEVDAASRTKVEDTRELLDNVQYLPAKGRFKIYIIDEVHMLSGHSFNALLKTLEEPPSHVKFLLATTDPKRLPITVLSRCLQFHLSAISTEAISAHLQDILKKEQIYYEAEAISLLAKAAQGSMRDALSLLDHGIAYGNGQVLVKEVNTMLGNIDSEVLFKILQALITNDVNALLENSAQLTEMGADFSRVLADILSQLHQIAVVQAAPALALSVGNERFVSLAQQTTQENIQLFYQIGLIGQRDLPWAPTPRSGFEMALLRMLAFIPQADLLALDKDKSTPNIPEKIQITPPPLLEKKSPSNWEDILKQLPLDGVTKALAEHCVIKEYNETLLKLHLHPKQQYLLNQKHIIRITDAVSRYLGRKMTVEITIDQEVTETPAAIAKRQQETQQQIAEQAIFSDPIVQQMIQTFDATVIKESINTRDKQ